MSRFEIKNPFGLNAFTHENSSGEISPAKLKELNLAQGELGWQRAEIARDSERYREATNMPPAKLFIREVE